MNQDLTMSSISDDTSPLTQIEIDQRVFDLYDEYCHGRIGPPRVPDASLRP